MTALPIAVIGAGPIGLAAAARLHNYGLEFVVFESGDITAAEIAKWAHVRMFSPWRCNIDDACRSLLLESGNWREPDMNHMPTGGELIDDYLAPLAKETVLSRSIKHGATVTSITRLDADRGRLKDRAALPFHVTYSKRGVISDLLCRSVIDASGVTRSPKPLGSNGLMARGEIESGARIVYGIPAPKTLKEWGERILVVGSGHTAMQSIVGLTAKAGGRLSRTIYWAIRRQGSDALLPVDGSDRFPARLALHAKTLAALRAGKISVIRAAKIVALEKTNSGVAACFRGGEKIEVDHIVVAAGCRPDYEFAKELQLDLDFVYECPSNMRSVIDIASGACSAVPPHGEEQLRHPERDFYTIGIKSFGRAPSFLLRAGYEQARSVTARLAGDDMNIAPRPFPPEPEKTLEEFRRKYPDYLETAFA